jgi:phage portal protein BeeE
MESNNLLSRLGSWLGFGKAAEKQFYTVRVEEVGKKGAVYLDTDIPYKLYNEIPELNQVVNKKADMYSNGRFKLVSVADGKEVTMDKELYKLLENPNILQPQNKWLKQRSQHLDIYGNIFTYKNKPSILSKYPSALQNISPRYINPILTGKVYDQISIEGIVKNYEYKEQGTSKTFETKDVIWSKIDDLDNPVIGCSPLKSLQFPLSNTRLAYDYLNIISGELGALGTVKVKSKDGVGSLPLTPERKLDISKQYSNDYGVGDGKARIRVTDEDSAWTPTSYPTAQLLLIEQIDANKLTICDHFGLNINIFSSKNQTYENVKNALIQCYTDTIIPFAESECQVLTKELGIDPRYKLKLDYSHIAILQPNELNDANLLTVQLNSVKDAVANGLLTVDQAKSIYKNSFGLLF